MPGSITEKKTETVYNFSCRKCGNCCTGDVAINLDLFDIYKIAGFMRFSHSSLLFAKRLIRLVPGGNGILVPRLHFRTRPFQFCPFLQNSMPEQGVLLGLCGLHPEYKPLVCRMAPAGRIFNFKRETVEYVFTPPAADCPGMEAEVKINLENVKTEYRAELDYEFRYYRILDRIIGLPHREPVMRQLCDFEINRSFEDILKQKEDALLQ